ncbi:MAG TPA: tetratricopeptide repeat protein [Thermoanaerobaculia bacterium]|jgi:tetratricopeptide (TPR) repeat protein|nr:tetratricopeptide repeat protein [Thermoanaerobaculia bacterium]
MKPTPSPKLSSLHQIPSSPADFTGRQEELSALTSLDKGGVNAFISLSGMGGVGKTTLALQLASVLAPKYPDAQFYMDLKGVDPQPVRPAEAMAHVIRSFHPEIRLPENEGELAALYRSVLSSRRTLLLLDNAASQEQVEPLLPPKGSLLLVTSRFHFALPGLYTQDLDVLPQEDARNMLLKIAPRIGDEVDIITRLCGGLPLALRLVGSALAERPDLSPTDYVRRLEKGKERLGPVVASLTLSYELLNEEQRRLWRLLAVFPGTFDTRAAAAVWNLEIELAQQVLGDLIRSSFVEWEENEERYRLHDLVRSFADRRLDESKRNLAQRRHAGYFLELLRAADNLYQRGGESLAKALRLFDLEWNNFQSGFAWASDHASKDETAARLCMDYPIAGAFLFALRQTPREQIRWREVALAAARQLGEKRSEEYHLGGLGSAYANLGEPRRAIEYFERYLVIAREIGDRRGEGWSLGNMGIVYADLGETRRAIEHYEQYLAIVREIGDRQGESNVLGNLANAYAELGETRRAIEYYEQAIVIAREIGDRRGEGNDLGNLGVAYKAFGETRRAIEYYEQAIVIAREIGDRLGEANATWNLGLAIEKEGDLIRAVDLMQIRLDYLQEIGHPDAEKHAARVAALRARIAEQGS